MSRKTFKKCLKKISKLLQRLSSATRRADPQKPIKIVESKSPQDFDSDTSREFVHNKPKALRFKCRSDTSHYVELVW